MKLNELNALAPNDALRVLLECCGAREWATQMIAARPFATPQILLDTADQVWLRLGELDWLEAFAAHPRIGDRSGSEETQREQAGALAASAETLETITQLNAEYEKQFGFIFIVFATGKTAEQMLGFLKKRMNNEHSIEIRVAAAEQMKITRLRLQKLLELKT